MPLVAASAHQRRHSLRAQASTFRGVAARVRERLLEGRTMNRRSDDLARSRRKLYCVFAVAIAGAMAGDAIAQFVLRQDVTASTGGTVRNSCFTLSQTTGEAVASPATSGNLKLFSGFWGARPLAVRDSLYSDGFEDCSP